MRLFEHVMTFPPVYVSIGHKVDLETVERWVLATSVKYRLPEPNRLAHSAASGNLEFVQRFT